VLKPADGINIVQIDVIPFTAGFSDVAQLEVGADFSVGGFKRNQDAAKACKNPC
jgi:hypothetical protein